MALKKKKKKETAAEKQEKAAKKARKRKELRAKRYREAQEAQSKQALQEAGKAAGRPEAESGNGTEERMESGVSDSSRSAGEAPAPADKLEIQSADIVCLAVRPDQYPPSDLPEVAFAGRSNVGKSSLLNLLTGRRQLARVSSSPGKTRTINFYLVNDRFRIVDLPGYGYASISREITGSWGKMMEDYFRSRPNLKAAVLLVDSRHEPTPQDIQMYEYMKYYGFGGLVVMTKADKLTRRELARQQEEIRKALSMDPGDRIIPVSSLKRTGKEELLETMRQVLGL